MLHLTVETLGQKLCVERSADHNINHGVLNRSNKKIDTDFVNQSAGCSDPGTCSILR